MNKTAFLFAIGCAVFLSGCDNARGGNGDKRISDLEKRIAAVQDQNRDLRAKMTVVYAMRGTPLEEFFGAPEFWQCSYDSSWADCSSRCAASAAVQRAACAKKTGKAQTDCYTDSANRVVQCVKNCPEQFSPASPPTCRRASM